MVLSDKEKILIKKSLYLKLYTAKRLTDEFPEKSWTKRDLISYDNHIHITQPSAMANFIRYMVT